MKIYGAALAREPRKSSPFCDCLNKAKIPFHLTDGTRRIFVCFAVGTGRYAGHKAPGKNGKECVYQENSFPCASQTPQKLPTETKFAGKLILPPAAEEGRKREKRNCTGEYHLVSKI